MDEREKFEGFEKPEENWSKLPHTLVNEMPRIKSHAEFAVIIYILRHTWGYREYEDAKRITLDEFEHGRKKRDGSRIDPGVGLSQPSIIAGLSKAQEHGFITVETDDSDPGRVKKFYALNMKSDDTPLKNLKTPPKNLKSRSQEPLERTEKETSERKEKKETDSAGKQRPLTAYQQQLEDMAIPLCATVKVDYATNKKRAGQIAAQLIKAGYTVQDVITFGGLWKTRSYPGGAIDGKPPTFQNVLTYIGWVKLSAEIAPVPKPIVAAPKVAPEDKPTPEELKELRKNAFAKRLSPTS